MLKYVYRWYNKYIVLGDGIILINYNSSYIRSNVERDFSMVCSDELDKFNTINEVINSLNNYLLIKNPSKNSMEYYVRLIISRISEHMISATLLIGKGFIIDGINLVRSSYEDLWLVQNIFFKENYFEEWLNGQEVRPWRLRQLKELEEIKEENEIIYKALCNISHCSKDSVEHMASIRNSFDAVINDFRLVVVSYYSFSLQILDAMENYYGDNEDFRALNKKLADLNIVMNED